MVQALAAYTAANARIAVAHGSARGIVVGTAPNETVMDFADYGLMCAAQSLGVTWPLTDKGLLEVYAALARAAADYVIMRTEIFGSVDRIMPATQPANNPYGVFTKTFAQYLDDNDMGVLKGYLMYAYQVQGYGALDKIPAYYGLVWITPDMAWPSAPPPASPPGNAAGKTSGTNSSASFASISSSTPPSVASAAFPVPNPSRITGTPHQRAALADQAAQSDDGERNHQGLDSRLLQSAGALTDNIAPIRRRERLGGVPNFYHRAAA